MATPLTVCLVVLGKHLPGLEFIATLMADVPPSLPSKTRYLIKKLRSAYPDLKIISWPFGALHSGG